MTLTTSGSIKAWKLYAETETSVAMAVMRPVEGSDTSFTLVGWNLVHTVPKRVTIVDVLDFERINVQAGDVIGWYYPLGIAPDIR